MKYTVRPSADSAFQISLLPPPIRFAGADQTVVARRFDTPLDTDEEGFAASHSARTPAYSYKDLLLVGSNGQWSLSSHTRCERSLVEDPTFARWGVPSYPWGAGRAEGSERPRGGTGVPFVFTLRSRRHTEQRDAFIGARRQSAVGDGHGRGGASGVVTQPAGVRVNSYGSPTPRRSAVHDGDSAKHWILVGDHTRTATGHLDRRRRKEGSCRSTAPFLSGGVTISYALPSGSCAPVVSYTKVWLGADRFAVGVLYLQPPVIGGVR